MRRINNKLLDKFRSNPFCEHCGIIVTRAHPHHVFSRGMGGGMRLDIPANLIALCPDCHHRVHIGKIPRDTLISIVAQREGRTEEEILAEIRSLRWSSP